MRQENKEAEGVVPEKEQIMNQYRAERHSIFGRVVDAMSTKIKQALGSENAKLIDGSLELLPFYVGLKTLLRSEVDKHEAFADKDLTVGERTRRVIAAQLTDLWGRTQLALDVLSLGEDKIVTDLLNIGGKKVIQEIGPGLTALAARVVENSPETAGFLEKVGLWFTRNLEQHPAVETFLAAKIDNMTGLLKEQVKISKIKADALKGSV